MPETRPSAVIKTMLDTQWNAANVPEPTLVDLNESATERMVRIEIRSGDNIVIRLSTPGFEETPIGNWVYGHRLTRILVEIFTSVSRQRLWDLMAEVRRICHSRMHSLTEFQRIQFKSFNELVDDNLNIWQGRVIIECINSSVLLEV